jgi:hypothetical protein
MAPIDDQTSPSICLACGGALPPALDRSASLRCHDCRDADAPLRPELVVTAQQLKLRPAA